MKEKSFNANDDSIIKQGMLKDGHLPRPFARIRKLIPQYKSKQIRNRWRNKLDPRLCHDPLDERERHFINQWVSINSTTPNGKISWIRLRNDLETEFGNFRSENKLKNYWYSKRGRPSREAGERSSNKFSIPYILNDDATDTNSFNSILQ